MSALKNWKYDPMCGRCWVVKGVVEGDNGVNGEGKRIVVWNCEIHGSVSQLREAETLK